MRPSVSGTKRACRKAVRQENDWYVQRKEARWLRVETVKERIVEDEFRKAMGTF